MDVTFTTLDRSELLVLPFVPAGGLNVDDPQNNETLSGLSWDINVIGNMGLKKVTLEGVFYSRRLPFISPYASTDPYAYVRFFERHRGRDKPPIRVVVSEDGAEVLNMPCTVDAFQYKPLKMGDLSYILTLRRYEFVVNEHG